VKTLRVILRWIQIEDRLEPFFKDHGEFFFTGRVTSGDRVVVTRVPEKGHWEISDNPRFNKVDHIDRVLFEGSPGPSLTVELVGEEVDRPGRNEHLEPYRRVFGGDPATWAGRRAPADEGLDDPESLSNWRVCYDIELS
jgi:hypothetical protein